LTYVTIENFMTSEEVASNPYQSPASLPSDRGGTVASGSQLGGVGSVSFLGLLITQFLGAMNDNLFRWLVIALGKPIVGMENEATLLSVGTAVFILPYILFAALAGYVNDRFSKQRVIVICKVVEVVLMVFGLTTAWFGSLTGMLVVLFLMGVHSTIFSPAKYGAIAEIVHPDRLAAANGLIGMTTIVAIVAGTVVGNYLYHWIKLFGTGGWWLSGGILIGVAGVGLCASLLIRSLPTANPARRFPWNLAGETFSDVGLLVRNPRVFRAALGTSLFWSLASLIQLNVDQFATHSLEVAQHHVGPLLAVLALGVGIGNMLAGMWSKGKIDLRVVPVGAAGMVAGSLLLAISPSAHGEPLSAGYIISGLYLFLLGLGAGMYDVPLQAFVQHNSPDKSRGSILAAVNFITFVGMIVATGLFYLMRGPLGLSGRTIFLVVGVALSPVIAITYFITHARPDQAES
jgi:acyl-[acyl-carrier-protein]-phospholipid O-acyltransferase/long-chain-fatty-acid--[acyl-carrier-protein] ligase